MLSLRRILLTAGATAMASTLPSAQTWRLDIDGRGDVASDLSIHGGEITLVGVRHDGVEYRPSQVTVDPQGAVLSDYGHAPFVGDNLSWMCASRTPEGQLVVAGTLDYKPWMAALDPQTGATIWDQGLTSVNGQLVDMCRNALGFHVAVGTTKASASGSVNQSYICAVDEDGGIRWRRTYGDGTHGMGRSITALAGGGMAMASSLGNGSSSSQERIRITWMNDWGAIQMQKQFTSNYPLEDPQLVATSDGGLFVVGNAATTLFSYQFMAFRLDAAGNVLWDHIYNTYPGDLFDGSYHQVAGAVQTPDGGFAVAVTQPMIGADAHDDQGILRLDANGNALWLRTYGDSDQDETAHDIAITPDGGFVLSAGITQPNELRLVRTNSQGLTDECLVGSTGVFQGPLVISVTDESFNYINDPGLIVTQHSTMVSVPATVEKVCGVTCEVLGGSFGFGLAGSSGIVPKLDAVDGACLGFGPELRLTQGLGGAPGFLIYGFGSSAIPVFGGTLYVDPASMALIPISLNGNPGTPGAGSFTLAITSNLTLLVGITLTTQAFTLDAGAPQGLSISNAATLTIQ
jgi:hypothetical protein